MQTGLITLTAADAAALATNGLRRIGLDTDEAETIAAHLVESELMGYPALGLARVLTIAEHPLLHESRKSVVVTHETPNSARVDGGNHVGMYAVRRGTDVAIEMAQAGGFALVGVHNTFLSGRNAYYLDIIARAGFVGIHTASGPPTVAPLGGTTPALGTNTIGVGFPHQPNPLIFDISTAAANVGDLMLSARLGESLPAGVAIDQDGKATRNPVAALSGAILPFGGHKGYALSLAVQAFGLLAGAALTRGQMQDFGFLFLVYDPNLLIPEDDLQSQIDDLIATVRATPCQTDTAEIRIPSERAYAERARRLVEGITLPRTIVERIGEL